MKITIKIFYLITRIIEKLSILWYILALTPISYLYKVGSSNYMMFLWIQLFALTMVIMQFITRLTIERD